MVGPALRSLAVAGVLAVTFGFGGVTAVPAFAQPDDSDAASSQEPGDTSDTDDGTEDEGGADPAPEEPDEPAESIPDEEPAPEPEPEVTHSVEPEPEETPAESGGHDEPVIESPPSPPVMSPAQREFENSISIPFLRLPQVGEIPAGSWPPASTFYTTVEIPVPTLRQFLEAMKVVPSPAPAPGPAFRTQQEAPVADATTGTVTDGGGGGGGGGGDGTMSEPGVFRAPLVTVPRARTVAGKPAKTKPESTAASPEITQPGTAGLRTPIMRGSVASTPGATPPPTAPTAGGQPARVSALPRGVTNPTLAEIAAVAVPGVAGLIFLTFSGGLIGYRQANSVRFVRTAGAERFLP